MEHAFKIALREQLDLGLIAYTVEGAETAITIALCFKEGELNLSWVDDSGEDWYLVIRVETLLALAEAMRKP